MDIYPQNISPLGYQTGQNGIDSYGVNHSGFSLSIVININNPMSFRNKKSITDLTLSNAFFIFSKFILTISIF